MTKTTKSKQEIKNYAMAILGTIKDAGPHGAPSGHIYAACMSVLNLDEYTEIIALLKEIGVVRESGHLLTYTAPKPRQAVDRSSDISFS